MSAEPAYHTVGRLSLPYWLNDREQEAFQSECARMIGVRLFFAPWGKGRRGTLVRVLEKDARDAGKVCTWFERVYHVSVYTE